jgi:hypothetical protein
MPHFFLKLITPRTTFAMDMNDKEQATKEIHQMRAVTRDTTN